MFLFVGDGMVIECLEEMERDPREWDRGRDAVWAAAG